MGLIDFFKNQNVAKPEENFSYGQSAIDSFFGNAQKTTEESALQIPALASGIDLIAGSIAQLDFSLIEKNEETGEVTHHNNDHRLKLLNNQPNEYMDAYTFKRSLVKDIILYGVSTSVIERNLNQVTGLYLLPTKQISIQTYVKDGYKRYSETILNGADGTKKFNDYQLLRILKDSKDGFSGKGILDQNSDVIKTALNESEYSSKILTNGVLPIGVLETAGKLSQNAFNKLKDSWSNMYAGTDKAGKTVILEDGMTYKPVSINPNDLQLIESRKNTLSDIARILNIPESMINSDANKYNSNEQNNLYFLQYCVSPILVALENAINKQLLLESEKEKNLYFKIDPSKLLQTTRKERAEAIGAEYKAGLISFWEARKDIDRPKTSNEDYFKLSLGDVLFKYKTNEIIIPNTMNSKASKEAELKQKEGEE